MKKVSTVLKKSVSLIFVFVFMTAICLTASAASVTDDFSSGKVEDRWTNGYIDGTYNASINPDSKDDLELKGVAKIEGGVLKINNKTTGGSFFYLAPKAPGSDKGVVAKNFEISFKVRVVSPADSWIGISVRKKTNDRYNGTNNVLMVYRLQENGIVLQANRSYGGNDLTPLKKDTQVYDKPFEGDVKKWNTIKLVVKDDLYTGYVNDVKIGEFKYDKVNDAGFVSINACVADIEIDDFKISSDEIVTAANTTTKDNKTTTTTKKPNGGNQETTTQVTQGENGETTLDPDSTLTDPTGNESSNSSDTTKDSKSTTTSTTSESKDKKGFPVWGIILIIVAVLGAAGAAVYFFIIRPKGLGGDGDMTE